VSEQTPGQAVYEAYWEDVGTPVPWPELNEAERTPWRAAAQAALDAYGVLAAVKAADGDTIVIAFSRPLDARTAHEVRERWAAGAPGVTLAIVDDVAAIEAIKPGLP